MLTIYVFDTKASRESDNNRWRVHSTYYDTNLHYAIESAKKIKSQFDLRAKVCDSHLSVLFDTH